jgi:hypothetical protein
MVGAVEGGLYSNGGLSLSGGLGEVLGLRYGIQIVL